MNLPSAIMHVLITMSLLCNLSLAPVLPPWEPSEADISYISRTIWGETRGCPEIEQRAQGWNILNRVDDSQFPNTVEDVVTAPNQFQGYSINNPVEPFYEMARDILIKWHNGEHEIPTDMFWCHGDGKHQRFRNQYYVTEETKFYP